MQLIELLSVRAPSPDVKLKLLKEIAVEHKLDWDPTVTETEFLKSHEDLLVSNIDYCLDIGFFLPNLCRCFLEWPNTVCQWIYIASSQGET